MKMCADIDVIDASAKRVGRARQEGERANERASEREQVKREQGLDKVREIESDGRERELNVRSVGRERGDKTTTGLKCINVYVVCE